VTLQGSSNESRDELFASLYDELRRLAQRELRRQGPAMTLGATTRLHEAYLNLQGRADVKFENRPHFLGYAARAMRGLIIDYARRRQCLKRGGAFELTSMPTDVPEQAGLYAELEQLNDAVERLAAVEPRLAQLVDLKYFGGFSLRDVATTRGVSERTVQRDWEKARLFLYQCLSNGTSIVLEP
jgi:RNA polymerase sigma factor (TIGR02999 family)